MDAEHAAPDAEAAAPVEGMVPAPEAPDAAEHDAAGLPARRPPDRLAVALAVGIAVLLAVCVALMLIAWHRAAAAPTLAAPGWLRGVVRMSP